MLPLSERLDYASPANERSRRYMNMQSLIIYILHWLRGFWPARRDGDEEMEEGEKHGSGGKEEERAGRRRRSRGAGGLAVRWRRMREGGVRRNKRRR